MENGETNGVRPRVIAVPVLRALANTLNIWYIPHMRRTIRLQLTPSTTQAANLAETSRQFTAVFNAVCMVGWAEQITNGVKLHHATYYPLKAAYPALVSDLLVQARVKATEAVKSAFVLHKQGRTTRMPVSKACPPRYNVHTYKVDWESQTVRMSMIGGRQTIRFDIPAYTAAYAGYPTDSADLLFRHGRWWLHVVVTIPAPAVAPTEQVVGVDLGIVRPAVTSNNRFLGKRAWKAIEGKLFHLKRALQKKGTKSAKRHLRRVRGKQARIRRTNDHILSKQIVQSVEPGGTIVLENLTDLRKRTKMRKRTATSRRVHAWSFAQLKAFIAYKAEARGCTVVAVDPRHTSQACSCCGHTARNNRRSRGRFVCRACGVELHADLNAARNIAAKYHASVAIRDAGGLHVNQPIVSNLRVETQAATFRRAVS
ncbi:MAG: IS200/IS605 family element transposase accessory protein TnpB [Roseiflexaceae bacterium]|nr:IS200/IS605 family element transposase accessory protein TnpB [Roseiflexaceae bacterium]